MERLNLVARAASLEPYVREKLQALKEKHPSVGDVRGLGLFFAVDLVKNRATKEPFNTMRDKVEGKPLVVDQIAARMMADGVAQQAWVSHFVIAPPLIVTKEELDLGIDSARPPPGHRRRAGGVMRGAASLRRTSSGRRAAFQFRARPFKSTRGEGCMFPPRWSLSSCIKPDSFPDLPRFGR